MKEIFYDTKSKLLIRKRTKILIYLLGAYDCISVVLGGGLQHAAAVQSHGAPTANHHLDPQRTGSQGQGQGQCTQGHGHRVRNRHTETRTCTHRQVKL